MELNVSEYIIYLHRHAGAFALIAFEQPHVKEHIFSGVVFCFFESVSASLFFVSLLFPVSLLLCFSASLLLCFSAFLLPCYFPFSVFSCFFFLLKPK